MSEQKPKKTLGQHWLRDDLILEEICRSASVDVGDFVVEVGPGLGTLTQKLLDNGADVLAIEFDEVLAQKLSDRKLSEKLSVINQDILKFNFEAQPKNYKVVANIPYYLTGKLVRIFTETANKPEVVVLLIQKEVAVRICAKPGSMSQLAVWSQSFFDCSLGVEVSAQYFEPPPKVDSQVVIMKRLQKPKVEVGNMIVLKKVISHGFNNRRKTLINSLSAGLQLNKETVQKILAQSSLSKNARPQELSIEQWNNLAKNTKTFLEGSGA